MQTFNEKIWGLMRQIPKGKVTTYGEIARAAKKPGAARAVGNACNANPDAPQTPCHRVVRANGDIGGYAHGVKRKIELLTAEGVKVSSGKIVDFENRLFSFGKP